MMNVASAQDRDESILQLRASGREFWRRALHLARPKREPAQAYALADNSPATNDTPTDMKATVTNYLEDLGSPKSLLSNSTLVTVC
jgi:hypothetical protein